MKKKIFVVLGIVIVIAIAAVVLFLNFGKSYKSVAKDLANAVSSEEKMDKFVTKNFDFKALYAIQEVTSNDDIDLDDEKEVEKEFKKVYKKAKKSDYDDLEDEVKDFMKELVVDSKIKLKDIGDLEEMDGYPFFKQAEATYEDEDGEEATLTLYFYKNKLVMIDSYDVSEVVVATDTLSEQEKDIYNSGIKAYLGDSVKGSQVRSLIDSIISMNMSNVDEEGKFVSVSVSDIAGYSEESDLDSACKTAKKDNSSSNVSDATSEMAKLKSVISAARNYKVEAEYEDGIIVEVNISEK